MAKMENEKDQDARDAEQARILREALAEREAAKQEAAKEKKK